MFKMHVLSYILVYHLFKYFNTIKLIIPRITTEYTDEYETYSLKY